MPTPPRFTVRSAMAPFPCQPQTGRPSTIWFTRKRLGYITEAISDSIGSRRNFAERYIREEKMKTLKAISASYLFMLVFAAPGSSTRADFARFGGGALAAQRGGGGPMGGMMGQGPQPRGLFNPVVGSGAQYEYSKNANGKDKRTMEIDVVGKEPAEGKDGYWLETIMSDTPMGEVVMKMLTVSDGATVTIEKMIMQMSGRPPMEMPQMGGRGQQKQTIDIRNQADDVGSESVATPAGTFTAHHYRMKDGSGDFWLSEQVSPYGLIKGQGKDLNIVLTRVVTDAKDKITGTPVPFNPRMMMPGGAADR